VLLFELSALEWCWARASGWLVTWLGLKLFV
jgi:hypothetical protein